MKKAALVLGVFCLMALAGSAFADPVVLQAGGSGGYGDWAAGPQGWYEGAPYEGPFGYLGVFNEVQIEWVAGALFDAPGLQNLPGDWSVVSASPTFAEATTTDPAVSTLALTVNFQGSIEPAIYNFQAYDGTLLVDDWTMYLDQSGSYEYVALAPGIYGLGTGGYTSGLAAISEVSVVPEPVSMIFFGTGLVAVGGYISRRRMLRKA